MSYNVQVGSGGYSGWKILERTMVRQKEVFSQSSSEGSIKQYYSKNISNVDSAADLVGDYKLLTVTLRAFGLDSDISNRFFVKKVLESDPSDPDSLVNKLADKRYLKMNQAMNFGAATSSAEIDSAAILAKYDERSFEKNIGERYPEIELALNAQREIPQIAESSSSDNAKWYQILGSKPLRQIFEVAYGLGSSFSALPIDRQLSEIKAKTKQFTGSDSFGQFDTSASVGPLIQRYLLRNQITASIASPHANALTLLKS